ncbi:carotenoid biosynthesis protein [Croceitalea rosinachiae]|uniref:Carotenoid biosynthesis protein n=1 Tax=Croceitalea rosinachiae TaxID=3075596 RepID=A0ABU3AE88_9FLAO|nr:carotenoid biosynthesis protein [Croceitalea sp. F388]MDT0608309.1 carotenoid biosynthesis protein [Croceitalea sp. F388]
MENSNIKKIKFGVFLIWLFHISGLMGIYFGNQDWFISKSPLNLSVSLIIFIWLYPINTLKKISTLNIFFLLGMFAEWLGVNFGVLFGNYSYGENLGFKLGGVPYLIGTYWALLTFITAEIAKKLVANHWLKITTGALLMVLLDFLMEKNAPVFDFWQFIGEVPVENYITWFLIGFLMHLIFEKTKIKGNSLLSIHLYCAQIIFFSFFYLFPIN